MRCLSRTDQVVIELRLPPRREIGEEFPERLRRRRATGQVIIDAHDLVDRAHLVERQRQLGIVGHHALGGSGLVLVDLLEAVPEVEIVAQRRHAAGDRAGAHGHQNPAVLAELAQHVDVLGVAHAAFDQSDVARSAVLDVGERRAVEFDQLGELEQALVDVEQRHVAAETAGERRGRDAQFALSHLRPPVARGLPRWRPRRSAADRRSACRSAPRMHGA